MAFNIDVEKLPRKALETAVKLNDTLKKIYINIYSSEEPATPKEIAKNTIQANKYLKSSCLRTKTGFPRYTL